MVGTALVTRYAAEAMKRRGAGAIVNLGSISSVVAQPGLVAYSATKAALVQMTRNMAMDLAPFAIRVNAVCPGTIITQATERHRVQAGLSMEEFLAQEGPKHLLNRVGQPREVAEAILFLASDAASFKAAMTDNRGGAPMKQQRLLAVILAAALTGTAGTHPPWPRSRSPAGQLPDDGPRKSAWNGMNEGTEGRGVMSAHQVENRCET